MPAQSTEQPGLPRVLAPLAAEHIPGLKEEDFEIMAARHKEKDFRQAGALLYLSAQQARRHWNRVREVILPHTLYPEHDDLHVAEWMLLHSACCAAPVFELIRNDTRFAS